VQKPPLASEFGPVTFDAVVFDFDETLVNLEPQHVLASRLLCGEQGNDYDLLPEQMRTRSGTRVLDDVREMRDAFGWSQSLETLHQRRRQLFDIACATSVIAVMPGAREAVSRASALGLKLAIASSGDRPSIDRVLDTLGLRQYFSAVVGGEDVLHGKPDPETYLRAAEFLVVPPSRCLAVEDSGVGVRAARAAGMFCIAVRNPGARTRQDLNGADLELQSMTELDFEALGVRS